MKQTENQIPPAQVTTPMRFPASLKLVFGLAIVALSAALAEKPAAPAAGAAAAPATETPAATAVAMPASESQVKLLAAGAEPRKVLRLHPKAGDKQTATMTLKMAMEMQLGESPGQAMKMPLVKIAMDTTVKSVSTNGDIAYGMMMTDVTVADDPDVMPQIAEALKGSMGGLKGLSGAATMSDRGVSKSIEMQAPADANPQLRQTIEQMKEAFSKSGVPLPEEAVGPGARWEFKRKIKSQGMTIDQTETCELVSIEDGRLTAKTTLIQNAANQTIENPGMPGMKLDLAKMTGKGNGTITVNLAQLVAQEATTDQHTEAAMSMKMGDQDMAMSMKMDINVRLETK